MTEAYAKFGLAPRIASIGAPMGEGIHHRARYGGVIAAAHTRDFEQAGYPTHLFGSRPGTPTGFRPGGNHAAEQVGDKCVTFMV